MTAPRYKKNKTDKAVVIALSKFGVSKRRIAMELGVTERQLTRHYKTELKMYQMSILVKALEVLDDQISQGNLDAVRILFSGCKNQIARLHESEAADMPASATTIDVNVNAPPPVSLPFPGNDTNGTRQPHTPFIGTSAVPKMQKEIERAEKIEYEGGRPNPYEPDWE